MAHKIASNMLAKNFKSTFMSIPRDMAAILKRLFVSSEPYSDKLKRLLIINEPDCLDMSQEQYQNKIDSMSVKDMVDRQYVRIVPKIKMPEFEEVKSYILIEIDGFSPSVNTEYRDSTITFTIISHLDNWQMDDFQLRPWMIAGYIDGILDKTELSGIGRLEFIGAQQIVFNEFLGGVILRYASYHSDADDSTKINDKYPAPQQLAVVDNLKQ